MSARPRVRRAFSLVELMLALVLAGLVGALVAHAARWGERVYAAIERAVGARAQLRDVAALLPADLRGASVPAGDLLALSDSAIAYRATLGAAILCAVDSARTRLDLPPTRLASGQTLAAFVDAPQPGDEVVVHDGGALPGTADDAWRAAIIVAATTSPAACVAPPFVDSLLDRGTARWRLDVAPPLPATVGPGAALHVLRPARYRLYPSQGRWWLGFADRGGGTWATIQPVSGPFQSYGAPGVSGIAFHYYDTTGVELASPVATGSVVARIDVVARTPRAAGLPGRRGAGSDSIRATIALRNRR